MYLKLLWIFALFSGALGIGQDMKLVFEDTFESFDKTKWSHEVTMWGGGNGEFQAYTTDKANTYVKDGKLFIKPTLTKNNTNPLTREKFGEAFLREGNWKLTEMYGYCTQSDNWGCAREGKYGFLPPVMSGRIRTKGKFSFRYGRMEIEAKMPVGDWLWPAIWFLPEKNVYGGWPRSGEFDLVESRGNRNLKGTSGEILGIQSVGSALHWGPRWDVNKYALTHNSTINTAKNFGENFHKFAVDWDENGLRFIVDDVEYCRYPDPLINNNKNWTGFWDFGMKGGGMGDLDNPWVGGTLMTPFDQEFHIILNVAVGGTNGYFPDDVVNNGNQSKPWTNTGPGNKMQQFWDKHDQWYPTWEGEDAAMQVKLIRVYQKPQHVRGSTITPRPTTSTQKGSALCTRAPATQGPVSSAGFIDDGKFQILFLVVYLVYIQIHN